MFARTKHREVNGSQFTTKFIVLYYKDIEYLETNTGPTEVIKPIDATPILLAIRKYPDIECALQQAIDNKSLICQTLPTAIEVGNRAVNGIKGGDQLRAYQILEVDDKRSSDIRFIVHEFLHGPYQKMENLIKNSYRIYDRNGETVKENTYLKPDSFKKGM